MTIYIYLCGVDKHVKEKKIYIYMRKEIKKMVWRFIFMEHM